MKKIFLSIYKKSVSFLYGTGISKLPLVEKIHKFIVSRLQPDYFEVFGNKMYLGDSSYQNVIFAESTPLLKNPYNILKKILKKGDIVVDIGASIGYYSLIFAKLIGETGKVIAIEPESKSCQLFKKNIEFNNYKNVILLQKAVSNKTGKAKLLKSKKFGGSVVFEQDSKEEGTVEIKTISLDDYFKEKINFIKIDAEGSEDKILSGMNHLLQQNKNLKLMMEYNPQALKLAGTEPSKFLENLINLGFTLYDMREENGDQTPITPKEIQNKYPLISDQPRIRTQATDLLCVRE